MPVVTAPNILYLHCCTQFAINVFFVFSMHCVVSLNNVLQYPSSLYNADTYSHIYMHECMKYYEWPIQFVSPNVLAPIL